MRVAVGSGMLTKSVEMTVCSPAALEAGAEEVSGDDAASELVVAAASVDTEPNNVEFPLSTPHHGQSSRRMSDVR